MNVRCPDCKEKFDLDKNEFDEGDSVECPECSASLVIKVAGGQFKLATEKEELYDFDEVEYVEE